MKILVLVNLYPPHHAGSFDLRCESVTEALRKRGHLVRVLTSTHGVGVEQRDPEIERRLWLNGVFDHPLATGFGALKSLETHNHAVLKDTVADFQPELVHVWSLHGLSKSLIFGLRETRLPTAYDVADDWLAEGIRLDPWLRWWNQPALRLPGGVLRKLLELGGLRTRLDAAAPTRMMPGYDRIPDVYGPPEALALVQPNSIAAFRFERIYFSSCALKAKAERAGFQVQHADVIYPPVQTDVFAGPLRPASAPFKKLLFVGRLCRESGILTALAALRLLRQRKVPVTLNIYGRGESDFVAQVRSFAVTHQLPVEFLTVSNLNRDLAAIYRQHDALLHTAEWDEPFALTPLEAMASGLPVVAAQSGGLQELLRHGENAFTYRPGDPEELAARIHELHLQPALRAQMAEVAQSEVMSRFNESVTVDQIESFLEATRQVWQGA
jgi:glycosyltransferase involved in cell wall biosynthesis